MRSKSSSSKTGKGYVARPHKPHAPLSEYFTVATWRGSARHMAVQTRAKRTAKHPEHMPRITHKREAIRTAKRALVVGGAGTFAEVKTANGQLIWQGKRWYIPNTNRLQNVALEL
jgi:hypothetical protein